MGVTAYQILGVPETATAAAIAAAYRASLAAVHPDRPFRRGDESAATTRARAELEAVYQRIRDLGALEHDRGPLGSRRELVGLLGRAWGLVRPDARAAYDARLSAQREAAAQGAGELAGVDLAEVLEDLGDAFELSPHQRAGARRAIHGLAEAFRGLAALRGTDDA